jgi:hypothetical protein
MPDNELLISADTDSNYIVNSNEGLTISNNYHSGSIVNYDNNYNNNISFAKKEHISLSNLLNFEQRESNILVIGDSRVLLWDSYINNFKLVKIKELNSKIVKTNKTHKSISNNITFNSTFSNADELVINLLLEDNDLLFIDLEKKESYKFFSDTEEWVLLDKSSTFNIITEEKIRVSRLKKEKEEKSLLIERKVKLFGELNRNSNYMYMPYVPLSGGITLTSGTSITNFSNYMVNMSI